MEEPQKLFRLPGTIEEDEERTSEGACHPAIIENPARADSPLLGQRIGVGGTLSSLPRNITLVRVSTQSSSIGGGVGRQDSTRSRYRAGPTRKLRRRAVLKNGECNVLQSRISRRSLRFLQDIFTTLVDTQWRWTLLCFTLSFVLSWLGFAVIWWLIAFTHGDFDERHLPPFQVENNWTPCIYNIFSFTSCFLFSIETQHTIGYGSRSTTEECPEAIFVMCIQSIAGVMIQAFMVGIVFAKMSRPKQRTQTLLFSRNAVICQRDGELCLMFRVGDMRKSHIIGAAVRAQVIRTRTTKEGEVLSQNQQELEVGTDGQNGDLFFIWPTTIVHKINADSPFYNMSAEDVLTDRFEVVVILEGTIESTGQTTQARSSYLPQEILWGHRFEPMVSYSKERQGYEVDYSLFNSTTQVDTPLCSGRELADFYRVQDEIRHGTGVIVNDDLLMDCYSDTMHAHCHCAYCRHRHQPFSPNHPHQRHHPLMLSDSLRSEISLEDTMPNRNVYRDPVHDPRLPSPNRDTGHSKITDVDPDAIHVMAEVDLRDLPEAVNKEILKNSREIMLDEDSRELDITRDDTQLISSPKPMGLKRGLIKYPFLDGERRSLSGSRRNLRNPLLGFEEDQRSLNGSRRNLERNGSKKYLLLALDKSASHRNLHSASGETLFERRRHTMSKERLNVISRSVSNIKGSKETPEFVPRRRINGISFEEQDRMVIETEKVPRRLAQHHQHEPLTTQNHANHLLGLNTITTMSGPTMTTSSCLPSPFSDFSPESGFYEGNQSGSSPESTRKTTSSSIPVRNRRSYEHAQLQDVNQALSRHNSGSSSSENDVPAKSLVANDIVDPVKHTINPVLVKQTIPCTSV